jgi:hypothetical protein
MMMGDENGDYSVSVSQANANPNPGKTNYLVVSQKVAEDSKAQNGHS